jgi:hypothetical protein
MRRPITALLAALVAFGGAGVVAPSPVAAACAVGNGANNGTDSGPEFGLAGFPGSDDGPNHDQGSWAPTNGYHDSWLKEWCEDQNYHDWVHDNFIKWEGTRWDKIQQYKTSRKIAQDININDELRYNFTGQYSSTLPYTGTYLADIFEQASQGYEEFSFLVGDVSKIVKAKSYNTRTQWDQERTDLGWIDSKSQWTDNLYFSIFYDIIGRMDAKKVNE